MHCKEAHPCINKHDSPLESQHTRTVCRFRACKLPEHVKLLFRVLLNECVYESKCRTNESADDFFNVRECICASSYRRACIIIQTCMYHRCAVHVCMFTLVVVRCSVAFVCSCDCWRVSSFSSGAITFVWNWPERRQCHDTCVYKIHDILF